MVGRIRATDAQAHVSWLCGTDVAQLVQRFEGVDEVIAASERAILRGGVVERSRELIALWGRLTGARFDAVWLLHPDPRYRALVPPTLWSRTRQLTRRHHGRMNPVPGRYLGDEYVRLLDGPEHRGPIERHFPLATLRLDEGARIAARSPKTHTVGIAPGGARNLLRDDPLRRWPAERYAQVAAGLTQRGIDVIVFGAASDDWVRPAFAQTPVRDMIGRLSLIESAALMRQCDLVITHDSGPLHLARLVRTPTLALFGPTPPRQVIGDDPANVVLWGGRQLACCPCFDGREFAKCSDNICLKSVTAAECLDAAFDILERTRSQEGPPNR